MNEDSAQHAEQGTVVIRRHDGLRWRRDTGEDCAKNNCCFHETSSIQRQCAYSLARSHVVRQGASFAEVSVWMRRAAPYEPSR